MVRVAEKMVDVTFVEKIVKPEPPPPGHLRRSPTVKPQPPARLLPRWSLRPELRDGLEKPPPPKPMVAPRRMPKEPPPEADTREDKGVAVLGDEGKQVILAVLRAGTTQGGVVGGVAGGAIELPDDAIPPRPKTSNAIPPYPQDARADGRTGVVVLEIVVLADGSVDKVRVVRGDEPFASTAVNTET